jgi:hypothetical protein
MIDRSRSSGASFDRANDLGFIEAAEFVHHVQGLVCDIAPCSVADGCLRQVCFYADDHSLPFLDVIVNNYLILHINHNFQIKVTLVSFPNLAASSMLLSLRKASIMLVDISA